MARELLKGVAWGVIVCGLMVTAVSLIAPPPFDPLPPVAVYRDPESPAAKEPEVIATMISQGDQPPVLPQPPAQVAEKPEPEVRLAALPEQIAPPASIFDTAPAWHLPPAETPRNAPRVANDPVLTAPEAIEPDAPSVDGLPQVSKAAPEPMPQAGPEVLAVLAAVVQIPQTGSAPAMPGAWTSPQKPMAPLNVSAPVADTAASADRSPPDPLVRPLPPAAEVAPPPRPVAPEPEATAVAEALTEPVIPAPAAPGLPAVTQADTSPAAPQPLPPGAADPAPAAVAAADPAPPAPAPVLPDVAGAEASPPVPPAVAAAQPEPAPAEPLVIAQADPAPKPVEPLVRPDPAPQPAEAEPLKPAPQPRLLQTAQADEPGSSMPGKRVGRLPTIGDTPATAAPEPAQPAAPRAATGKAIDDNSVPFEPSGQPLLAVVLIDDGTAPDDAALAALGMPVAFAVDATRPDAAQAMARYRAAGFEVLAMAPLPQGAGPSDASVALSGYLAAMPETVGVIEAAPGGLQQGRQVTAQVISELARTGHGLVAFDSGLNPARQIAQREGLPFGQVYRDIDGAGQDGPAIRRFLDQAAFRAGQDGAVILIGRASAQTIAALTEWRTGNRAATVSLAPVSAVMKAG